MNIFRQAFLLRVLDFYLGGLYLRFGFGFGFHLKNWLWVEYSFYQASECGTDTSRADLVEVGAGAQSSHTHSPLPLATPCPGEISWHSEAWFAKKALVQLVSCGLAFLSILGSPLGESG